MTEKTAPTTSIPETANPKDAQARAKVPIGLVPPALVIGAAEALADGARKYGAYNWRDISIRFSVYIEAFERHTLALKDGEDLAQDSLLHHVKHLAANCAIVLDALGHGNLIDDRSKGPGAKLLAEAHARRLEALSPKPPESPTVDALEQKLAELLVQQKACECRTTQPPVDQGHSYDMNGENCPF